MRYVVRNVELEGEDLTLVYPEGLAVDMPPMEDERTRLFVNGKKVAFFGYNTAGNLLVKAREDSGMKITYNGEYISGHRPVTLNSGTLIEVEDDSIIITTAPVRSYNIKYELDEAEQEAMERQKLAYA